MVFEEFGNVDGVVGLIEREVTRVASNLASDLRGKVGPQVP
jgi:hypothetical protein